MIVLRNLNTGIKGSRGEHSRIQHSPQKSPAMLDPDSFLPGIEETAWQELRNQITGIKVLGGQSWMQVFQKSPSNLGSWMVDPESLIPGIKEPA